MTRAWFRAWFRAWLVALRRSSCWWAKCKVNWKRSWIWFPCPGLNALNALPFAASNPGKPAKPTIGSPEVAWKWFDPVGHWIASSITKNMNVKGYQTLLGYMLTMPLFYIVLLWNVTWHVMIMWWVLDWADSSSSGSNADDLRSLWNSSSNQKQLECYKMWVWMWSLAASNELNFKWFCMILWICVMYLLHGSQQQSAKKPRIF